MNEEQSSDQSADLKEKRELWIAMLCSVCHPFNPDLKATNSVL